VNCFLLRIAGISGIALSAGLASGAQELVFTAREVNPVVFYLQSDHYCSAYPDGVVRGRKLEYIGEEGRVAVKEPALMLVDGSKTAGARGARGVGITGMWADQLAMCDVAKQQGAFYDSVWRDSIRFEAMVNYHQVFGPDLKGTVSLAPYAVDDGVVSAAMTKMLTTDTKDTLGAQNDDIMWWALAFLRAYEAHPAHTQYLAAAKQVFTRIQQTPDQAVCGGGVTWGEGTNYKNAITNALYVVLAARLAGLSAPGSAERALYVTAAVAEADWLLDRSRLFANGGLLQDGVHYQGANCTVAPDSAVWTYSQGVAIDGLAEVTVLTGNPRYADRAQSLLLRVLDPKQAPALVTADGILEEPSLGGRPANEDAETFKGLLVRHVGYALPYMRQANAGRYADALRMGAAFLTNNANTLWKHRRVDGTHVGFAFDWADGTGSAADPVDMRTTTSGLNLLNAAWESAKPTADSNHQ
jgi:predicted alpha-1,6-mannanase (GH76 family)